MGATGRGEVRKAGAAPEGESVNRRFPRILEFAVDMQ